MANIIVSKLDSDQITRLSYDEANAAMRQIGVGGTLVPDKYSRIVLTYITSGNGAGSIGTVTYYDGATLICVLNLTYDVSDRLVDVERT
jgi:hypothetical protein